MAYSSPTVQQVRDALFNDEVLIDAQIEACIAAADALVSQIEGGDACLTDATLDAIGVQLACHFCDTNANRLAREKSGDADEALRNPSSSQKGLESTWNGQNALLLDCSGQLANLGKKSASSDILFETPSCSDRRRDCN